MEHAEQYKILVNGQITPLVKDQNLADIVQNVVGNNVVAVAEHNGAIIPQEKWSKTAICAGDMIEIVHFVGGG